MQAIVTKYLGPTNFKGGRVKAKCDAGSIVVPWNHALDITGNHDAAVAALVAKLDWDKGGLRDGAWVSGSLHPTADYSRAYVWVKGNEVRA